MCPCKWECVCVSLCVCVSVLHAGKSKKLLCSVCVCVCALHTDEAWCTAVTFKWSWRTVTGMMSWSASVLLMICCVCIQTVLHWKLFQELRGDWRQLVRHKMVYSTVPAVTECFLWLETFSVAGKHIYHGHVCPSFWVCMLTKFVCVLQDSARRRSVWECVIRPAAGDPPHHLLAAGLGWNGD